MDTAKKVTPLRPDRPAARAPAAVSPGWRARAEGDATAPMSPKASAETRASRRRRGWLIESAVVAITYAIDGVAIGCFALTGTVSWLAGALYMGVGILFTGVVAAFIASGRSASLKDPSLSAANLVVACVLCITLAAAFPRIALAFALILFTVALSSTFRVSKRHTLIGGGVVIALFLLATLGLGNRIQIPHASRGEQFVAWLFFSITLGRCVMLSVINTANNKALARRSLQMKDKLAQIEQLAHHDELTGVLNRRRLLAMLADEMARSGRTQSSVGVAIIDLDHFKAVNDTLGHLAGDEVLKRFAAAVLEKTRNTDWFGRYGGEEFLMILTDSDPEQVDRAITRIRSAVAALDWSDISPSLRVTFSAGLARYTPGETAEQLLARADSALYAAKTGGRNCSRAA